MNPLSGAPRKLQAERPEQRRHVVGHRHQLVERVLERHVRARENPRRHEAEQQGHHGRRERDDQRVPDDVRDSRRAWRNSRCRRPSAVENPATRRRKLPGEDSRSGRATRPATMATMVAMATVSNSLMRAWVRSRCGSAVSTLRRYPLPMPRCQSPSIAFHSLLNASREA